MVAGMPSVWVALCLSYYLSYLAREREYYRMPEYHELIPYILSITNSKTDKTEEEILP